MKRKTDVRAILASNIKRIRLGAGLSQRELAKQAGLVINFVNDLEKGKKWVSANTLNQLSEALDVEPVNFFLYQDHWDTAEKQQYITALNEINKKISSIFDEYRDLDNKQPKKKSATPGD